MKREYITLVMQTIAKRRMRSWLTIVGVVIGVAAILSLITLGEGLKGGIEEQFEKLGISNIRVIPGGLNGPPNPSRALSNDLLDKVERIRGVDYVDPVIIANAVLTFDNEDRFTSVIGTDTETGTQGFVDLDVQLQDGRFFTPADNNEIIIGKTVATEYFDKEIFVKNSLFINDEKFTIIGIFEETGAEFDNGLYIPLKTARILFDQPDTVNGFVVHLEPGINIDEAANNIETQLLRDLDEDEFDLFTPEQILDQINAILGVVQAVVGGIAAISLIVGAVGIMNAMFTSVLERTNEIGIMKAIGATNNDILSLFIIEAGLIGLIGGIIGVIIGSALAFLMGALIQSSGFLPVKISIAPDVVLLSLLFAFAIGIVSGAIPAYKAAKLKPVDALRYE